MTLHGLLLFTGMAALLAVTPGVDMALVGRSALVGGRPSAVAAACGIAAGCLIWAAASAVGVAGVLAQSQSVYDVLRIVGGLYLLWLGIRAMRRSSAAIPTLQPRPGRGVGAAYRTGLFTNLANPKIVVFYATVLPGFVPAGASVLLWTLVLGAIHAALSLIWLCTYGTALTRAKTVMDRPAVRRALDRVTSVVLIGLGVRLLLERR